MITKQQVLKECSNMVSACWNHYASQPVSLKQKEELFEAISKILFQDFEESENYKALVMCNEISRKESAKRDGE